MVSPDVFDYYARGREQSRLETGSGRLEALRTSELLRGWLPPAPAVVLDVGGAAGYYALALAAQDYEVHLLDPVALHVQQAHDASAIAARPLASTSLGDARELPFGDESADAVLLLGPLYHLTERAERLRALGEAHRVLRPGGVAVIAAISRWASTMDGLARGFLREPEFAQIVAADVTTGVHHNPNARAGWLATAYFHRPDELAEEVRAAGLVPDGPVAVEGVASMAPDLDAVLDDAHLRERVMAAMRRTEREPALLGASSHLLISGRKTEHRSR